MGYGPGMVWGLWYDMGVWARYDMVQTVFLTIWLGLGYGLTLTNSLMVYTDSVRATTLYSSLAWPFRLWCLQDV